MGLKVRELLGLHEGGEQIVAAGVGHGAGVVEDAHPEEDSAGGEHKEDGGGDELLMEEPAERENCRADDKDGELNAKAEQGVGLGSALAGEPAGVDAEGQADGKDDADGEVHGQGKAKPGEGGEEDRERGRP